MELRLTRIEKIDKNYDRLDFDIYAPDRYDGFFEISFTIDWESDKSKKRNKQLLKTLKSILNEPDLKWKP